MKVRYHLGAALPREYRKEWPYALRRAMQGRRKRYRAMLKRLEAQGLDPKEAAVVASSWLINDIPPDSKGWPTGYAIYLAREEVLKQLIRERGPCIQEKLQAIREVESRLRFDDLDKAWEEAISASRQ